MLTTPHLHLQPHPPTHTHFTLTHTIYTHTIYTHHTQCYSDNFYFNKHSVIEIQEDISEAENALVL
jgi:hypothetical protein